MQIAFLTLFLGLTLGLSPVELSIEGPARSVEMVLDGVPVGRIQGPPWTGQVDFGARLLPHELVARALDFQDVEIGRTGLWINLPRNSDSERTAVPVRVKGALPAAGKMAGWFRVRGEAVPVLGVEEGPAQVVVVGDAGARGKLLEIGRLAPGAELPLGKEDRVRVLSPVFRSTSEPGMPSEVFDSAREASGSLSFLLTEGLPLAAPLPGRQRLADAVATAGLQAYASNAPRAVVLILGSNPEDTSRIKPEIAREYLAALRVPLFVWRVGEPAAAWGESASVASPEDLRAAMGRVREELRSQRIVWLEGRHLPQTIALSPAAQGIALP